MKIIQILTISILTLGSVANLTAEELQLIDNKATVAPKACNNKTQGCCSKMKQGGMKKNHMKNMEQRLKNIEALLKQLVELQKPAQTAAK
jgi:hypothetical protein